MKIRVVNINKLDIRKYNLRDRTYQKEVQFALVNFYPRGLIVNVKVVKEAISFSLVTKNYSRIIGVHNQLQLGVTYFYSLYTSIIKNELSKSFNSYNKQRAANQITLAYAVVNRKLRAKITIKVDFNAYGIIQGTYLSNKLIQDTKSSKHLLKVIIVNPIVYLLLIEEEDSYSFLVRH